MRIERAIKNTEASKERGEAILRNAITNKLQGQGAKSAYSWEEDTHVKLINITSEDKTLHAHMRNEKSPTLENYVSLHWLDKKNRKAGELSLDPETSQSIEASVVEGEAVSEKQWDDYVSEWEKTAGVVEGFGLIQPQEMHDVEKDSLAREIESAQPNPQTTEKALRYMEVYLEFEREK